MFDYIWRVKSKESIIRKYQKGINKGLRFNTVFNDLIGIRMRVSDYSDHYPGYFRIADMRTVPDSLLARMRMLYDNGNIKSKSDFMEVLHAEQTGKR